MTILTDSFGGQDSGEALSGFIGELNGQIEVLEGETNLHNQKIREDQIAETRSNLAKKTVGSFVERMVPIDRQFGDHNKLEIIKDFIVDQMNLTDPHQIERFLVKAVSQAKSEVGPFKGMDALLTLILGLKQKMDAG